jgi:hypothetical protein
LARLRPVQRLLPAAVLNAYGDAYEKTTLPHYRLRLRTGECYDFSWADPRGEWVLIRLYNRDDVIRLVEVRVEEIVWCAEAETDPSE